MGEQVPEVNRWSLRPSIGSCSGDCIASDDNKNWAFQIQNLCGRHDGRLGRRSRRDFLFVFAEMTSSIHDAFADAKELFPLYLLD